MNTRTKQAMTYAIAPTQHTPRSADVEPVRAMSASLRGHRRMWLAGLLLVICAAISAGAWGLLRPAPRLFAVNGVTCDRQAFYHRLEIAAGTTVAQQMQTEELKLQFARQLGVYPTEAQVEERLTAARRLPGYAQNLAATHQTEEDIRRASLVSLAEFNTVTKGVEVTDKDARAYYAIQSRRTTKNARYYVPETVALEVIVTDQASRLKQAQQELAQQVPFAEVAWKYRLDPNQDPSTFNNGVLGPIRRGQIDGKRFAGLEEAVFRLAPGGQVVGKYGGSWWLIRCKAKSVEGAIPFRQVQDECRANARLQKGEDQNGTEIERAFAAFRKTAHIECDWPQYREALSAR